MAAKEGNIEAEIEELKAASVFLLNLAKYTLQPQTLPPEWFPIALPFIFLLEKFNGR